MRHRSSYLSAFLAIAFVLVPVAATANSFQIGPIPGLTTAWHPAPNATSVPLGSTLTFRGQLPADASITWIGATQVSWDGDWSVAECYLNHVGQHVVRVKYLLPNGDEVEESTLLNVVAIDPEQISVSPMQVSVDPVELDEDDLNASTYEYFRGLSIASLRRVSDNWYRTSTRRPVKLSVEVSPPGFAPLMEWRTPERPPRLGSSLSVRHNYPHIQQIVVGPTANQQGIFLETYHVEITSHVSNQTIISTGVPVTFTAVTTPPGREDEITWLASTKYGASDPVMGEGSEFTVRFDDTWGPHPGFAGPFQWLGVKADNAVFNQDEKVEEFSINLTHQGTINGQDFLATGHGTASPQTGVVEVDWVLDTRIENYPPLCSIVTLAGTGGGTTTAREVAGGVNLLTLAGGNFNVTVTSPGIATTMTVATQGNTIDVVYETNGNFDCTGGGITSILPSTYDQIPTGIPSQFLERQFVMLDPGDGSDLIAFFKDVVYDLPPGVELPQLQHRDLWVTVTSESEDGLELSLRYESEVYPKGTRCRCRYSITMSQPIGGCTNCPDLGLNSCLRRCQGVNDCLAIVGPSVVPCPGGGAGSCRIQFSINACTDPCVSDI